MLREKVFKKQRSESACLHVYMTVFRGRERTTVLLSFPLHPPHLHPHTSPPSLGQLETEFIRFVLLLFSLPTAPFSPPPFPGPPCCRNRICRNHSKARYNLLLAVHNTPSHSHPFLNRTRCPADELIILEILFLLLIPPFYEQLLFMVQWI